MFFFVENKKIGFKINQESRKFIHANSIFFSILFLSLHQLLQIPVFKQDILTKSY